VREEGSNIISFTLLKADRPNGVFTGEKKGDWVRLLVAHHDGT